MLTVHHLENSRSQRILWLLEELKAKYLIIRYERDSKTGLAPDSLKAIHPLGKSPIITDGDTVLPETGAIIEYLLSEHHGEHNGEHLIPAKDSSEFYDYRYWMHAAEGSIMALLVMKLLFTKITQPPVPFFIRPISKAISKQVGDAYIDPSLMAHIEHMNTTLEQHTWFAGDDFTAADIMMSFPVEAADSRLNLSKDYPKLADFLQRIHDRPAYQKALEVGGPYELDQ